MKKSRGKKKVWVGWADNDVELGKDLFVWEKDAGDEKCLILKESMISKDRIYFSDKKIRITVETL